jgi:hypothetical protein
VELPSNTRIELVRTICHGRCPAYDLAISGDGLVVYTGLNHVHVRGERSKNVGAEAASGLVAEFLRSGFLTWKDKYETEATDLPSADISVSVGAIKKKISDYGAGEASMYGAEADIRSKLEALENRVDEVAQSAEWVSCPDEEDGRCREF